MADRPSKPSSSKPPRQRSGPPDASAPHEDPEVEASHAKVADAVASIGPEFERLQDAVMRSSLAASRLATTTRRVRSASQQRLPAQPAVPPDSPGRPHRVTSETWLGLSAAARADLWVSEYLRNGVHDAAGEPSGLVSLQLLFDVEFSAGQLAALRAVATRAFLAGAEREAQLEAALQVADAIRTSHETLLKQNGIPLPTERLSDPHGEQK